MPIFKKKKKIFCIGRNKTGTCSLTEALVMAGYKVAEQDPAEKSVEDWMNRDFSALIRFCKTADAFQDVPFSMPYTYQAMDHAFPGSKFILTVRDSADQWLDSLKRYHTKIIGKNRLPTKEDLAAFPYVYPGWIWQQQQIVYGADEHSLYDRDKYIAHYEKHNADVIEYFRFRPDDLLVLNLAEPDAGSKLCAFLGLSENTITVPHLNKSAD